MANFIKKKIDLDAINNGNRYNNGDVVDSESINAPIEASAYAQDVADIAEKKATVQVRNVSTITGSPGTQATVDAEISYESGDDSSKLDMSFRIPQGKQGRSFTPRGTWRTGITYYYTTDRADTVFYDGNYYVARVNHLSSTSILPTNTNYWSLIANKGKGFEWRGSWDSGVIYINNDLVQDMVEYNGNSYIVLRSHTGSNSYPPTNTTYFKLFAESGATYKPSVSADGVITWSNDKGYANPPASSVIKTALANAQSDVDRFIASAGEVIDEARHDVDTCIRTAEETVDELVNTVIESQGTVVEVNGVEQLKWDADTKMNASEKAVANGVASLDANGHLAQRAKYDTNGRLIASNYSSTNPPPYPVTSVNGKTGTVTITQEDLIEDLNGLIDERAKRQAELESSRVYERFDSIEMDSSTDVVEGSTTLKRHGAWYKSTGTVTITGSWTVGGGWSGWKHMRIGSVSGCTDPLGSALDTNISASGSGILSKDAYISSSGVLYVGVLQAGGGKNTITKVTIPAFDWKIIE